MSEQAPETGVEVRPGSIRPAVTEDWLALALGLLLFGIALFGLLGYEPFGWAIKTNVWLSPAKTMTAVSARFGTLPGLAALGLTYLLMAAVLGVGIGLLGAPVRRFLAGFIVALLAGLVVGNFLPRVTTWIEEAVRPEWYIKTAIVLLGAALGVKSAEAL